MSYPTTATRNRRGRVIRSLLASVALAAMLAGAHAPAVAQGTLQAPIQAADLPSPLKVAREGYALTPAAAEELEAALKTNPDDLAARTRLLGFYFRQGSRTVGRDVAVEARRRHILWLIEHRPGSGVMELSEVTIDKRGHALADSAGFEQAAAAWTGQVWRRGSDARVLGHAARFFLLSDKEQAASFLRQAQQVEPANPEWRARLGYVYALAILGVDMMNQNGLPTSHNAAEAKSAFALRTIEELKHASDATIVGVAGTLIGQQGLMLSAVHRGQFAVDHETLSDVFIARAQELEPKNPQWSAAAEQIRSLRAMRDRRN
jgi:hypothetical protein